MVTSLKARLAQKWQKDREAAGIFPPYRNPFIMAAAPEAKAPDFGAMVEANELRAKARPIPPPEPVASAAEMKAAGWRMSYERDETGRLI